MDIEATGDLRIALLCVIILTLLIAVSLQLTRLKREELLKRLEATPTMIGILKTGTWVFTIWVLIRIHLANNWILQLLYVVIAYEVLFTTYWSIRRRHLLGVLERISNRYPLLLKIPGVFQLVLYGLMLIKHLMLASSYQVIPKG